MQSKNWTRKLFDHISESTLPPVGDKAVNAEARATLCVMKNLRMRDKTRYAQREREAQRINYIPIATTTISTTITTNNNLY